VELWSAHVPARLSNFCCRTRFVRRDVRVERSSDVTSLFPEMEEMLIEKVRQRTFLYDTKSPDYRDQHMRANAWEGIGKELKIKRKFYVSLRDASIVCPWLYCRVVRYTGKVKVTLVQALRLCTGRTAHRRSRGIALLFHDQRH